MSDFPNKVNVVQAYAVEGDFASMNPWASLNTPGNGAFIADALGVTVGKFAWVDSTDGVTVHSFGVGLPSGFVGRRQGAGVLATSVPGTLGYSMLINKGLPVTLYNWGDFWARNAGATAATVGMKAYAMFKDGSIQFYAAATPPTTASVTASIDPNVGTGTVAANSATGTIAGNVLTLSAVATGGFFAGQGISGTGIDPGTAILAQLTGTAGGAGTYSLNISQTIATGVTVTGTGGFLNLTVLTTGYFAAGQTISGTSVTTGSKILSQVSGTAGGVGKYAVDTASTAGSTTITATGGTLTVTIIASGSLEIGDILVGAGVTSGNYITGLATGTGGLGKYLVSVGDSVGSEAITVTGGVETKFYADTAAGAGELVKMSAIRPSA